MITTESYGTPLLTTRSATPAASANVGTSLVPRKGAEELGLRLVADNHDGRRGVHLDEPALGVEGRLCGANAWRMALVTEE
jgi:hypothetical protein